MQGINPADVAAGILIAAFILVTIAWGYRNHRHERAAGIFAFLFFVAGGLLVWWRVDHWMVRADQPKPAAFYCDKYGLECPIVAAPKAP